MRPAPSSKQLRALSGLTPLAQCRALGRLAAEVSPGQVIVEIGVYLGRTACWLAAGAAPGVHVYGVDPWELAGNDAYEDKPRKRARFVRPVNRDRALRAARSVGLDGRITLVTEFSTRAAVAWPRIVAGLGHLPLPIGLMYIDGDHREAAAYNDFTAWSQHMAPDAVVCWDDHDADRFPGVVAAVARLVDEGHIAITRHTGRMVITRRIR